MKSSKFFIKVGVILVLNLMLSSALYADPNVGTITRINGDVDILNKATSQPKGQGPWIKFENKYYKSQKARVGFKLKNGDIVNSFSNGKAMVIFPNGDQISVGPGSSYQMTWDEKAKKDATVLKLLYGSVRGVVSPQGPRNVLKMETKSAVAGVRGTDFSMTSLGRKTEVSVLRGKVSIASKEARKEVLQVNPGFSGEVEVTKLANIEDKNTVKATDAQSKEQEKADLPTASTAPIIKKITKEKLVEIQTGSTISEIASKALTKETSKEIISLESKAKESVLEDIKKYNPKDYEALKEKKDINYIEINTSVISKLFKEAPQEIKEKKFTEDDFDDLDSDIYKKYFK